MSNYQLGISNYDYLWSAHTFSCNLRFFLRKVFYSLFEVFTYSLVCQYVKDLVRFAKLRRLSGE